MNIIVTIFCPQRGCHADNKFDVIDGIPALKRCRKCDMPLTFMIHDVVETQRVTNMLEKAVKDGTMIRSFRNGHYEYQSTKKSNRAT